MDIRKEIAKIDASDLQQSTKDFAKIKVLSDGYNTLCKKLEDTMTEYTDYKRKVLVQQQEEKDAQKQKDKEEKEEQKLSKEKVGWELFFTTNIIVDEEGGLVKKQFKKLYIEFQRQHKAFTLPYEFAEAYMEKYYKSSKDNFEYKGVRIAVIVP